MGRRQSNNIYVSVSIDGAKLINLANELNVVEPRKIILGSIDLVANNIELLRQRDVAMKLLELNNNFFGKCRKCGARQSILFADTCSACGYTGEIFFEANHNERETAEV